MLFRLRELVRNLLFRFFMAKKNDLEAVADRSFSPAEYTQTHIANTTIITKYEKDGDVRFFRECRPHQALRQCLRSAVEDYFDRISRFSQKQQLKAAVFEDMQAQSNYKRLAGITSVFDAHLMEILSGLYCDYAAAGVPCFGSFDAQTEFIAFIKYISGVVISQRTNSYLPKGAYENFSANKLLATYRLACLLGVENLITPVSVCAFSDGDTFRVGTMMEKAPGYPPSDLTPEARTKLNKATFLQDITNLEYLDAVCYQLDHRLDNYYVVEDEQGLIARVVAFDNDAARTFFINPKLPKGTYAGCASVLRTDGGVARPYMDAEFYHALGRIDKQMLKQEIGDFLSGMQLNCLWKRLCQLRNAAQKTAAQDPEFLVSDWSKADSEKAQAHKYGCTYYHLYLTDTLMLDRQKQFEKMAQEKRG